MEWWDNTCEDVLEEIFKRIDGRELITTVYHVCQLWRSICERFSCWDHLFWKGETLDLTVLDKFQGEIKRPTKDGGHERYDKMAKKLTDIVKKVMEDGRNRSITCVQFPPDLLISAKNLVYIAKRSQNIKKLILPRSNMIVGKGFSKALRCWEELNEVSIVACGLRESKNIIRELGINGQNLKILHINGSDFPLEKYEARFIAASVPQLRMLKLENSGLNDEGLFTLTTTFPHLEKLNTMNCVYLKHVKRRQRPKFTVEEFTVFQLPDFLLTIHRRPNGVFLLLQFIAI